MGLRGDPSRRRKNTTEPEAPAGWPDCPEHVTSDPIAFREWQSVCTHLETLGLLSGVDAAILAIYAKTYARWLRAEENIDKFGEVLISKHRGTPMLSPYYTAARRYSEDCRKYLIEFGLSPASRARMRIKADEKPDDRWGGILDAA